MPNSEFSPCDEFLSELQSIVDRSGPEARANVQKMVDSIARAGGTSFGALLALAIDSRVSSDTRYGTIWVLGQLGNRRAVPALISALKDKSPILRAEAARQLGLIQGKRAIVPLAEVLCTDVDAEVRKAAAYALGYLQDPRSFDALSGALRDLSQPPLVRGMAAEQLASFSKFAAIPPLIAALHDPSAEVRFWAAYALGAIGSVEALPDLEQLAATDTASVPGWWSIAREAREAIEHITARSEHA